MVTQEIRIILIFSMAKLADLRSNLSKEERDEYEKYRQAPEKIQDDDIKVLADFDSKKGDLENHNF